MTFAEKTVIRIVLLVAKWMAPAEWCKDIEQLSSHIHCGDWLKRDEKEGK
jgi:hypothetical protein